MEYIGNDVKNFSAFKVSSTAMIRASPFWEKVFLGPFAEAQPGHMKVLNYIEDDIDCLQILLDIIHLRFNRVPPELTLESLADMAALTDKFCATRMVGPWIQKWLDELVESSRPEWIWISWEYGLKNIYDRAYRKLCMSMAIDEHGAPLISGTLPPTIEGKHLLRRLIRIS